MSSAALIMGEVTHERTRPTLHRFTYPLLWLRVPIHALAREAVLPVNRRALLAFWERDHGARDGGSLFAWIQSVLRVQGVSFDARVLQVDLYAAPRLFGFVFNPVSFWVCRRPTSENSYEVFAVLAEVNNTFGESHRYLLTAPNCAAIQSGESIAAEKLLHVSPFNEVHGHYKFRFNFSDERWLASIDYFDQALIDDVTSARLLHTHVSGRPEAITQDNLRRALLRYPMQSIAVVARIHWHAVKLYLKRVPFHGKLVSKMTGISRS